MSGRLLTCLLEATEGGLLIFAVPKLKKKKKKIGTQKLSLAEGLRCQCWTPSCGGAGLGAPCLSPPPHPPLVPPPGHPLPLPVENGTEVSIEEGNLAASGACLVLCVCFAFQCM